MLQRLLLWLGFGLCHQLPERSFIAGGLQAPVCARDTGIYVGFMLAFILISVMHRDRPRGLPPAHVWAAAGLWLAFMAWDGVTSYGGLRTTTNEIRLITGLGVGFSAAALMFPMLNDELWRRSSAKRVLEPTWRFVVWLVAIPLTWVLITYVGSLAGIVFIIFTAAAIPITLTIINMVIVCMLPPFDRRAERLREIATPIALAFGLTVAEIAGAALLRGLLIGWASAIS